jgi:hypothetical protein
VKPKETKCHVTTILRNATIAQVREYMQTFLLMRTKHFLDIWKNKVLLFRYEYHANWIIHPWVIENIVCSENLTQGFPENQQILTWN